MQRECRVKVSGRDLLVEYMVPSPPFPLRWPLAILKVWDVADVNVGPVLFGTDEGRELYRRVEMEARKFRGKWFPGMQSELEQLQKPWARSIKGLAPLATVALRLVRTGRVRGRGVTLKELDERWLWTDEMQREVDVGDRRAVVVRPTELVLVLVDVGIVTLEETGDGCPGRVASFGARATKEYDRIAEMLGRRGYRER